MRVSKSACFLIHTDTGQRYPIKGPVVIGRNRGDIVFSGDSKLSIQHCSIEPQRRGLAVRDLHSVTGTKINGAPISPDRSYLLRPDDKLSLGEQTFVFLMVTRSPRTKKRRKSQGSDNLGLVFLLGLLAAGLYFYWQKKIADPVARSSAPTRQLAEIFENYQELQLSFERQSAPPLAIADRIQERVATPLSALMRRYAALQAKTTDPLESRNLSLKLHFANVLSNHARTELMFIRSGDPRYSDELDQIHPQLEKAVSDLRLIPGAQFPDLIQSPLQIVERELRQSIRDYRKLGAAVQAREVDDKKMAEIIREQLMPKFDGVSARLSAIQPQNDFERKKVALQQRLLTAVNGQLKSMSLYAISKDQKYAREQEHWGAEIQKVNDALKQQLNPSRVPASGEKTR